MTDDAQIANELIAILGSKDDHGAQRFSFEEQMRVLALLLLASGALQSKSVPPGVVMLVGRFGMELGLTEKMSQEEIGQKISTHVRDQPIDRQLLLRVQALIRDNVSESPSPLSMTVRRLLGDGPVRFQPRDDPAPKGSVRSGPLARFSLDKKDED
jgi:hypothetical protein